MARLSGAFGNLIRGILASLVGVDLLVGATSDDPSKVKSLDQVLVTTEHLDLGPPALGVAAAGLLSFGVLSLFEARYRRV
jgi:hypothetical protein